MAKPPSLNVMIAKSIAGCERSCEGNRPGQDADGRGHVHIAHGLGQIQSLSLQLFQQVHDLHLQDWCELLSFQITAPCVHASHMSCSCSAMPKLTLQVGR